MDALALERAKQRIADAAAGRPEPAAVEAALERSRQEIETLAAAAAELEASIPVHVGRRRSRRSARRGPSGGTAHRRDPRSAQPGDPPPRAPRGRATRRAPRTRRRPRTSRRPRQLRLARRRRPARDGWRPPRWRTYAPSAAWSTSSTAASPESTPQPLSSSAGRRDDRQDEPEPAARVRCRSEARFRHRAQPRAREQSGARGRFRPHPARRTPRRSAFAARAAHPGRNRARRRTTTPLAAASSSSMRPPSGVQRNAFERRFVITCSTRSPSETITGAASPPETR